VTWAVSQPVSFSASVSDRRLLPRLHSIGRCGELVWSYHWHPSSGRILYPHTHLGHTQLAEDAVLQQKAHNPTGRVSLESVVRACITEYGVAPMRDDWDKTLALREGDFQLYRSWS
jgi:hypothetical protein